MIRTLLCTVLVVATLTIPALAEDSPDIAAIRARLLYAQGDYDAAFAAMKPLAEQGVPRAEVILGFFYERGIGTEVNEALAVEWYEKAAAHNQPAGLHNLGYAYQEGILGLPKDIAKAKELYLRAVEMEYPSSIHNLSRMYIYGDGVDQDVELGRALLERAVTLGHPEAAADLGYMLATGDGLPIDLERSREAYLIGAANGIDWAERDYAEMMELGQGGPISLEVALDFYRRSAARGYGMAAFDIFEMYNANKVALADIKAEALAMCFYAEAQPPQFDGSDYDGQCDPVLPDYTPGEITAAREAAKAM